MPNLKTKAKYLSLYDDIAGKCIQHYSVDLNDAIDAIYITFIGYNTKETLMVHYCFYGDTFEYLVGSNLVLNTNIYTNIWVNNQINKFFNGRTMIGSISPSDILYGSSGLGVPAFKDFLSKFIDIKSIIKSTNNKVHDVKGIFMIKANEWRDSNPGALREFELKSAYDDLRSIILKHEDLSMDDFHGLFNKYQIKKIIDD